MLNIVKQNIKNFLFLENSLVKFRKLVAWHRKNYSEQFDEWVG